MWQIIVTTVGKEWGRSQSLGWTQDKHWSTVMGLNIFLNCDALVQARVGHKIKIRELG